jgi:hypothetical protein
MTIIAHTEYFCLKSFDKTENDEIFVDGFRRMTAGAARIGTPFALRSVLESTHIRKKKSIYQDYE